MKDETSLALLTDLYQLTMAYGYWKLGHDQRAAVFHLFFRRAPFAGGYAVVGGLGPAIEFLQRFRFDETDLAYLATLRGNDGGPLFDDGFLRYLQDLHLSVDVDAMPEGTVAYAQEPLLRISGPILQCQILETALLNVINFQTLIATKAARICGAAGGQPVLEFGLRRAQGMDGGLAASRAAYLGGCAATSNVLAGKRYGIPVKGTHAHSWVMSFDDELAAFAGYAQAMPNNCVFLVDTYDTLEGVAKAITIGKRLRELGHEMVGIRLDSGDLAYLSIEARKLLDAHGFPQAAIVASNDLDEQIIESLKSQGAQISVWGVGTKLATAYDQPALGGVYKLGALKNDQGEWLPKLKLSEQAIKTSIPGTLQVKRFQDEGSFVGDMIYDELRGIASPQTIVDIKDNNRRKLIPARAIGRDLLVPVMRNGQLVGRYADGSETLAVARERAQGELAQLHSSVRRLLNPHEYPVGMDLGLHRRREQLIQALRWEGNIPSESQ
ncbi:MAG: nicotinate phosphoribosyltransferase [Planctomycetales bacterium]|nr:nicotinate phosphoribosyltransferase [Planctomycetales bacterium]